MPQEDRPHRIIDVITGVRPQELIFESQASAEHWLEQYSVSAEYKQQHYRIVPNERLKRPN